MLHTEPELIRRLLDSHTITPQQASEARALMQDEALQLFPALLRIEGSESRLRDKIAHSFQLQVISHLQPYEGELSHIETLLKRHSVYPVDEDDLYLTLACCDPSDSNLFAAFYLVTNKKIRLRVCGYTEYMTNRKRLEELWGGATSGLGVEASALDRDLCAQSQQQELQLTRDLESDSSPVARLVADIIEQALTLNASDIHFEPQDGAYIVRLRIDGVLQLQSRFPVSHIVPINTRIKLMAEMDITEKRRPQDGRIQYQGEQDEADIRVSSLATMWGEKLVLRLLSSAQALLKIPELGMPKQQMKLLYQALNRKQGLVLVTGPTGSGKTQTLYAALDWLNHPTLNISTAEDPIEISLHGLNQTQINPVISYGFAQALKTFLRQDPDIIMLGEIRDQETADICVKASQTGHLVLSTLHTNSAIQALYRLQNLDVALFNIVTSVRLIIAQRLVRRLCPHCREQLQGSALYQAHSDGCMHCQHGYKGRIGVYEFLPMTPRFAEYIMQSRSEQELQALARDVGFYSMAEQAQYLINQGTTDQDEINRVLGGEEQE